MEIFDSGLAIKPKDDELGFNYGQECFGPTVELRKLDDIRKSLMDKNCLGPDIVYAIAMNVGKRIHQQQLKEQHLVYGVVTFAQGKLGKEPVRSQGHIHKKSLFGRNWSTPEVYQIWSGKAIIYMQEYADNQPGRCYAVEARPGDIVIVPPNWAHATISADMEKQLTFGAWCDSDYGYEYEKVRKHKGLAWYPVLNGDSELEWIKNKNYGLTTIIKKGPNDYSEFGIKQKESIYKQYEKNPDLFSFVSKPYLMKELWIDFIP